MTSNNSSPETLCAQAMGWIDETTKAIVQPVHVSTTYLRDEDNEYRSGRSYVREDNPTWDQAEALITRLENGAATLLFSAGMAAATAPFLALGPATSGVAGGDVLGRAKRLLGHRRAGASSRLGRMTDLDGVRAAVRPGKTKMIWAETPSNPMWPCSTLPPRRRSRTARGARSASIAPAPRRCSPGRSARRRHRHACGDEIPQRTTDVIAGALRGEGRVLAAITACAAAARCWDASRPGCCCGACARCLCASGQCSANALSSAGHLGGHPRILEVLYPGPPQPS